MHSSTILIVDGKRESGLDTVATLRSQGHTTHLVSSLSEGFNALERLPISIAIVDVQVGSEDGRDFCRRVRSDEKWIKTPVMMLSACTDVETKLSGFAAGSDDHLCRPVETREFLARVNVLLRRSGADSLRSKILESLTRTEARILNCFLDAQGRTLSRNDLAKRAWSNTHLSQKTVDAHINNLRAKIRPFSLMIENRYGIGYKLAGLD